ncbi:MAG: serine/threonine-protein kinase, partial [Planctomycetota bacterium]
RVGEFDVERLLAVGGMGAVYVARQQSPSREVALKVTRRGLATEESRRRFRYESEILGSLIHPNIAQVYSAGTFRLDTEPVPYFAMELVDDAETITDFARAGALGIAACVRLFLPVCEAVHFGHQKGIIHRDLKPGNVLVDAAGTPKVIDYGVARLSGGPGADSSIVTEAGRVIGTLRYASPEQCAGRSSEIDARADVYALGVLLYEMLVGRSPYDLEGRDVVEAAKCIAETPPARPSSVRRELRGDLETILLKALEKDPARRYASAAALGGDLERWLDQRPIAARPASTMYQLSKLASRHRPVVVGLAVGLAALVVGSVVFASLAIAASRAADAARAERDRAESLNDYLASIFRSISPGSMSAGDVSALAVLDAASQRAERELANRPSLAAPVRVAIARAYFSIGAFDSAQATLARAIDAWPSHERGSEAFIDALVRHGESLIELGRLEEAAAALDEALAVAEAMSVLESSHAAIEALAGRGIVKARSGDLTLGAELVSLALERGESADVSEEQRLTMLNVLAVIYGELGRYQESADLLRQTARSRAELLGPDHPSTLISLNNLSNALRNLGDLDGALDVGERVLASRRSILGAEHPETLGIMNNVAIVLSRLDREDEAIAMYREVLRIRTESLGASHPQTLTAKTNLVVSLMRIDEVDEADRLLADAYDRATETLAPSHGVRRYVTSRHVQACIRRGDFAEAESIARAMREELPGSIGATHWEVSRFGALLGVALAEQGRREEAAVELTRARDELDAELGADHPWSRWARQQVAE